MRVTTLIDNRPAPQLTAEWGLAFWIEYQDKHILLDTGGGENFARNAAALGIYLSRTDFAVLSHAHWDHADGLPAFFRRNPTAPLYLRQGCGEDCYDRTDRGWRYEGIRKGTLAEYADRIRFVSGPFSPAPGVSLLPHTTPGLAAKGKAGKMYRLRDGKYTPDDFSHEQSLVFQTARGLVIFNSCCHAGADVIVRETQEAFPGQPIRALVGGFHLFETPDEEVYALGQRLAKSGVEEIVTGHCTGERGFQILKEVLGERAKQLRTGLVIDF